jgi:cytochrome c peroxidase
MTAFEQEGEKLFGGKGKCQQCHSNKGSNPLFTDFAFHNLGVPKNPANPVYHYGTTDFDPGLGGFTDQARHMGKFRTPTTRNVAMGLNRTYMHNGALISLVQVVDFYNTRDVHPVCTDTQVLANPARWGSSVFGGADCWPPPEHGANLDSKNMGKLGLTADEVRRHRRIHEGDERRGDEQPVAPHADGTLVKARTRATAARVLSRTSTLIGTVR